MATEFVSDTSKELAAAPAETIDVNKTFAAIVAELEAAIPAEVKEDSAMIMASKYKTGGDFPYQKWS